MQKSTRPRSAVRLRELSTGRYAVSAASIAAAALGNVLCYKIVAVVGSSQILDEYSTARRYLTFGITIALLGAGVALPLRSAIRADVDESRRILYAQFAVAAVLVLGALGVLWAAPLTVTQLLPGLGRPEMTAVLVMILAFNCTGMLYSFHRGFHDFRQGAVIVVLANGLFPAVGALFAASGAAAALWVWAALCFALAVHTVHHLGWPGWGRVRNVGSLLRSSVARMPGDAAYAALFLIPVAQMQAVSSPERQAVFNHYFVLLGSITAAAAPLSAVLLPVVGGKVATEGTGAARRILWGAIALAVTSGLVAWGVLAAASEWLVGLFLAPEYVTNADVVASLSPAALGMALFVFVRSVLDGAGEKPFTAVLSLLALMTYAVVRALVPGTEEQSIIIASNSALLLLGVATVTCALYVFSRRAASVS